MKDKRIVVVGMGVAAPQGIGIPAFWDGMIEGRDCTIPISQYIFGFDPEKTWASMGKSRSRRVVTQVCGINQPTSQLRTLVSGKTASWHRHQVLGIIAADEAAVQARLSSWSDRVRVGCFTGVAGGGISNAAEVIRRVDTGQGITPTSNLGFLTNMLAGYATRRYGLQGESINISSACAASSLAIIAAMRAILADDLDAALVGGAESVVDEFGMPTFAAQAAVNDVCKPFQRERAGFQMGEGAAALVITTVDQAMKYGLPILAEIAGYGSSSDGNEAVGVTSPDLMGGARSAVMALEKANLIPSHVDYINAHGTGTPDGDKAEIEGVLEWALDAAPEIMVSSTKGHHGHLMGGAGALEAIVCIQAVRTGIVIGTRGLSRENLDPACSGVEHVLGKFRSTPVRVALSNSFGFGGTNATLVFKRWEE